MPENKLRSWERWIVLLAIILFVRSVISTLTNDFNNDVDTLISYGFPARTINDYTRYYNHFLNTIFPISAAAILMYAAWYIFHYYAYNTIKQRPKEPIGFLLLFLTIILVGLASWVYHTFKLYWNIYPSHSSFPEDFTFRKSKRLIYIFTNGLIGLWLIFLYEILSQALYFVCKILRREGPMYSLIINFIFATTLTAFIIAMSESGYYLPSRVYDIKVVHYLILGVALVFLQDYLYHEIKKDNGVKRAFIPAIFIVLFVSYFSATVNEIIFSTINYKHIPLTRRLQNKMSDVNAITLLIAFLAFAISLIRFYYYRQRNKLQTQVDVKSAELDQLRAQINPHFLFNALNTLYSVSLKENAETTASGIQKLGDMMRFMLNENHQEFISLEKEIEQLENYIDIQQMRLNNDIKININIQKTDKLILISPMLLNPFVENAFKHGISFRSPSWIFVTLTYDENTIYFKVHNSIHKTKELDPEKHNHGIGLENVKKRLELIYPKKHTLVIEGSDQDFFVSLSIKY